ncbi:MAG: hypothetical protein XD95_0296 [Microgenomates bacterium 39_7]|nr:MAG: hypothetical protein XD95_0296 [Microgenomates bacterium 39_7]
MFKGNMRKFSSQLGFTMIELLIVITILGILAVAVLSAINPIEQINRGRDTGSQSDAEQLLSAIDRYNAFQGYYPWQEDANDLDTGLVASSYDENGWTPLATDGTLPNNDGLPVPVTFVEAGGVDMSYPAAVWIEGTDTYSCPIMARLSGGDESIHPTGCRGAQELKDSFVTRLHNPSTRDLYVYNSGVSGASTYVCFIPQSGAFEVAAFDRCAEGLPEDVGDIAEAFICAGEYPAGTNPRTSVGLASDVPMSCLP